MCDVEVVWHSKQFLVEVSYTFISPFFVVDVARLMMTKTPLLMNNIFPKRPMNSRHLDITVVISL